MSNNQLSEKDLLELINAAVEDGSLQWDIDDQTADALLSAPCPTLPIEVLERLQDRLRRQRCESPIREARKSVTDEDIPFGRFIELVREKAGLGRAPVAKMLRMDEEFVQRVERGDVPPDRVGIGEFIRIMDLFVIGYRLACRLCEQSYLASQSKTNFRVAARSHGGRETDARSDDVGKALDAFVRKIKTVSNKPENRRPPSLAKWLGQLEETLQRNGQQDLLK